jgi:hypothetical protein
MRNQRSFSLEFKRQVIEELLSGESGAAQLCRRHNITSSLLYHWKKQYSRGKFNNEPTEEGALRDSIEKLERLVGIRHITASPFHPQTNGKIERYHRSIKGEINRVPYDMPSELKEAIRAFIEYYNYRRYHEGLGNVTPYEVYSGSHLEILQRRKEVKSRTLEVRRDYNRTAREQGHGL